MNTNYTSRFCLKCRASDTEFIADCQKVLRGSGFWLRRRGRNPNRQQFLSDPRSYGSKVVLGQSLRIQFASYFGLYVERSHPSWVGMPDYETPARRLWENERLRAEARAVGMVLAVARIYALHGKPIAPELNTEDAT